MEGVPFESQLARNLKYREEAKLIQIQIKLIMMTHYMQNVEWLTTSRGHHFDKQLRQFHNSEQHALLTE